jgi:hypothetical protein
LADECRVLRLTGQTMDGCPIAGEDVVYIKSTGRLNPPLTTPPATGRMTTLHAAQPNPVAWATQIRWELATPASATLAIYDVVGRRVRGLVDGWLPAGSHTDTWDGTNDLGAPVANGVYLYVLDVADGSTARLVRKLVVRR